MQGARKSVVAWVIALLFAVAFSISLPSTAHANGRFPASNALFFTPSDPNLILLRTTFGVLVSRDRAATWDWLCERSLGITTGDQDPMFAITPNGTLIASTFGGLAISRDGACSFTFAAAELTGVVFTDVASRPGQPSQVIALSSAFDEQTDAGEILYKSILFETLDEGTSFARVGPRLDPTLLAETLDVTATDPDRIYLTATRDSQTAPRAFLLISRNHGQSWLEEPIPLEGGDRATFIAGVDPTNADRVYVRTAAEGDNASRLLVTDDAGKTFRVLFRGAAGLAGFAISPDGAKIWVGSSRDGVQMATAPGFAFTKRSNIEVGCLVYASDGLWACSTERTGFVAGLSTDDGATFATKLRFCDIRGPLACPAGTSTNVECAGGGTGASALPPWPTVAASLGCDGRGPSNDASANDAGGDDVTPTNHGGGCGACALGTSSSTSLVALLAALGATAVGLGRRAGDRRRGSRRD